MGTHPVGSLRFLRDETGKRCPESVGKGSPGKGGERFTGEASSKGAGSEGVFNELNYVPGESVP